MSTIQSAKTVGNYILINKLGRGTFADVYFSTHSHTGERFAIKVIAKDKILDPKNPKLQENLDTEISIMRDYNHENLVRLYDHFHSSRYIYLVLELCAGGDLSNYIKKSLNNRLDEKSAANFLFQLCSGLKFLHEKNIIHRDLKPANVLLSSADNNAILKLADFGFAKQLAEAALAQTACGTPLYMAPEIFEMNDYDYKCDIWSVGCIFFEMLTGQPPFKGFTPKDLLNNIKSKPLTIPPNLSISKESFLVLRKLLNVNPSTRATLDQLYAACICLTDLLNKVSDNTSNSATIELTDSNVDVTSYKELYGINAVEESAKSREFIQSDKLSTIEENKSKDFRDSVSSNFISNKHSPIVTSTLISSRSMLNPSSATTTFLSNNLINGKNSVNLNSVTVTTVANPKSQRLSLEEDSRYSRRRNSLDGPHDFVDSNPTLNNSTNNSTMLNFGKLPNDIPNRLRSSSADSPIENALQVSQRQSNEVLSGYSWNSNDEDFVIVESVLSQNSKSNNIQFSPASLAFHNVQNDDETLTKANINDDAVSELLKDSLLVCNVVVHVCGIADKIVTHGFALKLRQSNCDNDLIKNSSTIDNDTYYDSMLSAISLYSYILTSIKSVLKQMDDLKQKGSIPTAFLSLISNLLKLYEDSLIRIQKCYTHCDCVSNPYSGTILCSLPNPLLILYQYGINSAKLGWLSGDIEWSLNCYKESQVVFKNLLSTNLNEHDSKVISYYLECINIYLQNAIQTKNSLI